MNPRIEIVLRAKIFPLDLFHRRHHKMLPQRLRVGALGDSHNLDAGFLIESLNVKIFGHSGFGIDGAGGDDVNAVVSGRRQAYP